MGIPLLAGRLVGTYVKSQVQPWALLHHYIDFKVHRVRRKVAAAVEQEAKDLADAVRDLAQAVMEEGTGNLVESIQVVDGRDDLEKVVVAGGELTTVEVTQGSGVGFDYALAQEFGTRNMSANPFFWPVIRIKREGIEQRLVKVVEEAIG